MRRGEACGRPQTMRSPTRGAQAKKISSSMKDGTPGPPAGAAHEQQQQGAAGGRTTIRECHPAVATALNKQGAAARRGVPSWPSREQRRDGYKQQGHGGRRSLGTKGCYTVGWGLRGSGASALSTAEERGPQRALPGPLAEGDGTGQKERERKEQQGLFSLLLGMQGDHEHQAGLRKAGVKLL